MRNPLSEVAMNQFYLSYLLPLLGGFQAALSFYSFPCMQKGKSLLSDSLVGCLFKRCSSCCWWEGWSRTLSQCMMSGVWYFCFRFLSKILPCAGHMVGFRGFVWVSQGDSFWWYLLGCCFSVVPCVQAFGSEIKLWRVPLPCCSTPCLAWWG